MPKSGAVRLRIAGWEVHERRVMLRMPFRFGVVTMTEAPQLYLGVRLTLDNGREAAGMAASLLAPKWFDKNPALSNEDNFAQLRRAVALAAQAYVGLGGAGTAFDHFEATHRDLLRAGAREDLQPLVTGFGQAMFDAAVLDALGRGTGRSFFDLVRANAVGLRASGLFADLADFDLPDWLASLRPSPRIAARHTVGLVDVIGGDPRTLADGLPESLQAAIRRYGHRHFKLKVSGAIDADIARLEEIATVIDATVDGQYMASLDGNEQYETVDAVVALWARMNERPALRRLVASIRFIEQPIARAHALAVPIAAIARQRPVIIDESDDTLDAFPAALGLGYAGVSSKLCKGVYKSLVNAARCERERRAGHACMISGEDLTNQAGLAVQQDLALVSLLGVPDVERNGHHYVDGMACAPADEARAFAAAHPDLYEWSEAGARVRIVDGLLSIGSLDCPGFASAVLPRF